MSCSLSSLWATTHSSLSLVICSVGSHFLSSGPNSSLRPPYFLPSMLTGLFNKFLCSNCRVGVGQRAGTQETLAPSPRLSRALPSYPGTWFLGFHSSSRKYDIYPEPGPVPSSVKATCGDTTDRALQCKEAAALWENALLSAPLILVNFGCAPCCGCGG